MAEEPTKGIEVECPVCNHSARLTTFTHPVELFGELLFNNLVCSACGFKWNDVQTLKVDQKPVKFIGSISKESDIKIKIVKSSTTTIRVPELEVEIEPGPISDGYVTNIEGLLDRIQAILGQLLRSAENDAEKKAAQERLETLLSFKQAKEKFHVELLDPFGNAIMLGNHVKKEELSGDELKSLKIPVMMMDANDLK
jgi:zinc finger protein